jgi:hypothetical protein
MKVRFVIKEQVQAPAEVKDKEELKASLQSMFDNLDGAQLAALEKYAMELSQPGSQPTSPTLGEKKEKMTKSDEKKREKYVKGMKSSKKDFEKRYGKDAEDVMYATATKMAMKKKKK